jgi:hypothetical protein
MKAIKKLWKNYKKPTPIVWRKIGDALLAVNTFLAGFTLIEGWSKWIAVAALCTGVIGKFLTNFFAEKKSEE